MTATDLRLALRSLVKRPGLTAAVVASLALGVGANVAVFSLAKAVLIEPLPFDDPDELVMVWERNFLRDRPRNVVSPANFLDWKEASQSFDGMAALVPRRLTLSGTGDAPVLVSALEATEDLFALLGAPSMMGRTFSAEEYRENARVAVVTYELWRGALAGDPAVLGTPLMLEEQPYTIIGVLPRGFRLEIPGTAYSFPIDPMVFLPRAVADSWRERGGRSITVIARRRAGVELEAAQAEMDAIAERLAERYPDFNTGWGVNLVALKEQIVGESRATLLLLWAAVTAMLAIVAANVANLLLGRGLQRRREIAIRTAIGAGGRDIIRQLLLESLVLTTCATVLGIAVAHGVIGVLKYRSPIDLPRLDTVAVDGVVLLYALGATIVMTLVFGLVPALQSRRTDVTKALREEALAASSAGGHSRLRGLLVVSEVALAVALIAGAGLLVRTLVALRGVDTGFQRNGVATLTIALPDRYDTDALRARYYEELLSRIEALPDIDAAGVVSSLPLTGPHAATSFWASDAPEPARGEAPVADIRIIRGDYFRAMAVPLLAGRPLDARDGKDAPPRGIVSAEALRVLWPGEDPSEVLGREVVVSWGEPLPVEVIAVVGDVRHQALDVVPRPMIYWPHDQNVWGDMTLVALSRGSDADEAIASVLGEVRALDPNVATLDVGTLTEVLDASVADRRVSSVVLGAFALLAMGLASLGVYGVVSFSATSRSREMSLRLALGATPSRVIGLVLSQGLAPVVIGVGLGLVAALAGNRLVSSLLYGVSPTDPVTLAASAVALVIVAAVAAYLPARRTSRLGPATALRSE
ncbi:MAG TPA: ABC transporter permease [Vicinamibacteria bacterium]|nr:ABC transporter permease [Vicinamibacteria bacterium]